jgi:lipopolysaccharide/colanic/teichoic acid biosynthesis glycosyltransferase
MPANGPIESQIDRIGAVIRANEGQLRWRNAPFARRVKRALDLLVALPATVVALPIMGVVALIIRLSDPGPVLFKQQRVGLDGELFTIWKFRTMKVDPLGERREVTAGDPRVIRFGSALRDLRLDELPQLLHVVAGKMSLVGPRPDLVENLAAYADEHLVRFAMPPGCTAWTFTRGAFANDWATRQSINAEYVARWTVWLDVKVLIGSLIVIITRRNTSPTIAEVPGSTVSDERTDRA